jgi:hypothetical protein
MDRCTDRAIVVRFVSGMLRWISLGRGCLGRRYFGDNGAACEAFEMDVSERKEKLQRHRCKSEPTAPPPIGTNPTHWQNAPTPRLEQCTVEPIRGNAFSMKTSLPSENCLDCCPNVTVRRRCRLVALQAIQPRLCAAAAVGRGRQLSARLRQTSAAKSGSARSGRSAFASCSRGRAAAVAPA